MGWSSGRRNKSTEMCISSVAFPLIAKLSFVLLFLCSAAVCEKKSMSGEDPIVYRELKSPFRMGKLNLVWNKALHRLSETKLRSLYTDLTLQDKEELQLKRLIADGADKEGIKEAEVRKKLKGIMNMYGLAAYFEGHEEVPVKQNMYRNSDNDVNKSIFKDKKLNKLWEKAEKAGFDEKELKVLKEEFFHHENRIGEYYSLLEGLNAQEKENMKNSIDFQDILEESDNPKTKMESLGPTSINEIRMKHREIKDGYDLLHKQITSSPGSREFSEPRVEKLWRIATQGKFSPEELESLQNELKHYEKRLEKLHRLQGDYLAKTTGDDKFGVGEKDVESLFADKVKRQQRYVEKLHSDLEERIVNRRNEL